MSNKKFTSIGFGVGMMVFMTISLLKNDNEVTTRSVVAILVVGVLCGGLWYLIFDKVINR